MKRLKIALTVAMLAASNAWAIEACLESAAKEFSVEPNVLDAMRQDNAGNTAVNKTFAAREFGPMLVSENLIKYASRDATIDAAKAKIDPCENYRVAAWFLGDVKQRRNVDIWEAVKEYYFGHQRKGAVEQRAQDVVLRIKKLAGA